jgi:hypothetical protein
MSQTFLPQLNSIENRKLIAEILVELFKQWELHELNQAELLGLKSMAKLKHGNPLPDTGHILERAGHLLAIHRALIKLYPTQENKRNQWITRANLEFNHTTPLKIMLEEELDGIKKVREFVEDSLIKN